MLLDLKACCDVFWVVLRQLCQCALGSTRLLYTQGLFLAGFCLQWWVHYLCCSASGFLSFHSQQFVQRLWHWAWCRTVWRRGFFPLATCFVQGSDLGSLLGGLCLYQLGFTRWIVSVLQVPFLEEWQCCRSFQLLFSCFWYQLWNFCCQVCWCW